MNVPIWLGVVGMIYTGAYVGSAIFSEIFWRSSHSEHLKALFKRTLSQHMVIHIDNVDYMKWDMRELRSLLHDHGMQYNEWDLVLPDFIHSGTQAQTYSFMKGMYLGALDVLRLERDSLRDTAELPIKSQTLYDDTVALLDRISVPTERDDTNQIVTFTDPKFTKWVKDQEKDFRWT